MLSSLLFLAGVELVEDGRNDEFRNTRLVLIAICVKSINVVKLTRSLFFSVLIGNISFISFICDHTAIQVYS